MSKKNFEFGNCSDKGRVRRENEDYMGYFECFNGDVFLVCDGMGGHAGGAFAAQLAVSSVREFLERKYFDDPIDAIREALQYANSAIYQKAQTTPEYSGMGTTAVMVIAQGNNVWWGHVGDSRVYLYSFDGLRRLTNDHSFVQRLIDDGAITEEEALTHPRRNELLAALGVHADVAVEVFAHSYTAMPGDILLMCTDGLTNAVSEAEIESILGASGQTQGKALKLVELANNNGGPDNITVQLVAFSAAPATATNNTTTQVTPPPPAPEVKKQTSPDLTKTKPVAEVVDEKPAKEEKAKASEGGLKKLIRNKNFQFWGSALLFLVVMGSFFLQLADLDFTDYNGAAVSDTTKKPVVKDTIKKDSAKPAAVAPQPVLAPNPEEQKPVAEEKPKTEEVTANKASGATETYEVKSGDLLYNIAKKYGTTQAQIMKDNPSVKKPEDIKVGQKLIIKK